MTVCLLLTACDTNLEFKYGELIQAKLDCMGMPRPDDSYNYPVYPGMPEWSEFKTTEDMVAAIQVPENILKKMSTQAVIQAIWEYPLLWEVVFRLQYQMDFDGVFSNNSAYKELIKRVDAGISLLERLNSINPVMTEAKYEPKAFEILISQDVFLSQLNKDQKKEVIRRTMENDYLRQQNDELRDGIFRATAWLLIGKILKNAGYGPFIEELNSNTQLKSFIEDKNYTYFKDVYKDIPQLIIRFGNDYIK
jgi:hypothetical protein